MIHRRPRRLAGMMPCSSIAYTARRPMSRRRAISSTVILARGFMAGPPPFPSGWNRGAVFALEVDSIEASGGFAWSCPFDTHNEFRFAAAALSGDGPSLLLIPDQSEICLTPGPAAALFRRRIIA